MPLCQRVSPEGVKCGAVMEAVHPSQIVRCPRCSSYAAPFELWQLFQAGDEYAGTFERLLRAAGLDSTAIL